MAKSNATLELKSNLKRLVRAIVDDEDAKVENFDETSKTLICLRDLKLGNDKNNKNGSFESLRIPEQFLCPISSEIMKDPVVLASGQTYDRPFIQEWLNSGNRTCPQTQQVLTNPTLIPNHLVRSMISQWCTEHGITLPLPSLDNPDEPPIPVFERNSVSSLLKNLSSSAIAMKKQAVKDLRLLTKQKTSVRAFIGQSPEAIPKLLLVLSAPNLSGDREVQEDAVTTVLNLSIFDSNKKIIGDDPRAIPSLIDALKTGTMQTRCNAAAALFSLSALESNKIKIGELGATRPLIELLEYGTLEAKKDAANAIFNLCTNYENRARAVSDGVAGVLLLTIMDKLLVGELLAILALVSGHKMAVQDIVNVGGVAVLLEIIRKSSCTRNKENAVVVIYSVCVDHRMKLREVEEEETLHGSISELVNTGTSRARRKAADLDCWLWMKIGRLLLDRVVLDDGTKGIWFSEQNKEGSVVLGFVKKGAMEDRIDVREGVHVEFGSRFGRKAWSFGWCLMRGNWSAVSSGLRLLVEKLGKFFLNKNRKI